MEVLSEAGVAPGLSSTKRFSSHGLKKGRTRTVHSRPVHGAERGQMGLSLHPRARVSPCGDACQEPSAGATQGGIHKTP